MLRTTLLATSLVLAAALASQPTWADEACQSSLWGPEDQLGAANWVSPERTKAAAALVTEGQSHPLGIVIEPSMPSYPPRYTQLQVVQPMQQFGLEQAPLVGWDASYNDDMLQMWLGTGPQLDGLGHMGESGMFYNCNKGSEFSAITGLTRLDISNVPPLIARGVLLDMAKHFGVEAMAPAQGISADDIKAAMAAQTVTIGQGDVVLIHTGWTAAQLNSNPQLWASQTPGITNDAAVYLASLQPMAVGTDSWSAGALPPKEGDKAFYEHVTLLKEHGIYLLETMNSGRLAQEGVKEFMFVLGQARLKGAVQMIINPVAMW